MCADVVATQGPGRCDPMMAVENVVLAAPCPHLDGREWLTLAHGDQYAAQAGASSITDRPEVPVEQLRCAVNRPHDAGNRDELFAGRPKLPRPLTAAVAHEAFSVAWLSGVSDFAGTRWC
jgi:hypothetical protein